MKIVYDYAKFLSRQCEIACSVFGGKASQGSSERIFTEICKQLTKDFLPPIDREDIAAISLSLLEIASKSKQYAENTKAKEIMLKNQLDALHDIVSGLLNKKKTCGEDIRRLININLECSDKCKKSVYACSLNSSISDFLKIVQMAYFKNL